MSVLFEMAMFPTDKGESASPYVSRVIKSIRESGVNYQLTAMGTIIETETMDDALQIIRQAYELLSGDCNRVYCAVKFDIRQGKTGRMQQKIQSIERKIGEVNKG
jgi:uncharacterized protein (TIGR00106 family)